MRTYPIIKARFLSPAKATIHATRLAYIGYADQAAKRFDVKLHKLLDIMLEHGWAQVDDYLFTFA